MRFALGSRSSILAALAGGVVALLITVAFRYLLGTKLFAEVALDAATDGPYPEVYSFLLRNLRDLAKPLFYAAVLAAQMVVLVGAWRLTAFLEDGPSSVVPRRAMAAAGIVAAAFLVATGVLELLFDASLGSGTSWPEYLLVTAAAAVTFALSAMLLESLERAGDATDEAKSASRRALLRKAPAAGIGIVGIYLLGREVTGSGKGGTQAARLRGPTPEVTSNDDFYVISKNLIDPKVDGDAWRLRVTGAVAQPLEFDIDAIRALPSIEEYVTLQCISNEVNGDLMGNALWKGVPMRTFLQRIGAQPGARYVWFESEDDYTETVPIDFASQDGVMLAYEMNGVSLPQEHGFPLRLLAPGRYGMKQPKWIRRIVLRTDEDAGYWSKRGWDTEANMKTTTRIDVPRTADPVAGPSFRIEGVAFSGRRGIRTVEVSTDDGTTWRPATLRDPLSLYTWVLWSFDWTDIPVDERVRILARSTDGEGKTQTAEKSVPFPSGASGYPAAVVRTG
jgi:DMSO/TMAO reductase YedYZ molybdopterin-dependent catalytic subunit